jgi:RNA polymerase sigma-70 factor (ECF subfamily)
MSSDVINDSKNKDNTERFLLLMTPIQPRIYAYIFSLRPNRTDADDIMQETITAMWRRFGDYTSGTDFQAWAFTVAKYSVFSYYKKRKNLPHQFNEETMRILQSKSDRFIETLDTYAESLNDCVKKLPEKDALFLNLRYDQGQTIGNIARRFDVTTRAVYKILSRIHNTLLRCVRRSAGEEASL